MALPGRVTERFFSRGTGRKPMAASDFLLGAPSYRWYTAMPSEEELQRISPMLHCKQNAGRSGVTVHL